MNWFKNRPSGPTTYVVMGNKGKAETVVDPIVPASPTSPTTPQFDFQYKIPISKYSTLAHIAFKKRPEPQGQAAVLHKPTRVEYIDLTKPSVQKKSCDHVILQPKLRKSSDIKEDDIADDFYKPTIKAETDKSVDKKSVNQKLKYKKTVSDCNGKSCRKIRRNCEKSAESVSSQQNSCDKENNCSYNIHKETKSSEASSGKVEVEICFDKEDVGEVGNSQTSVGELGKDSSSQSESCSETDNLLDSNANSEFSYKSGKKTAKSSTSSKWSGYSRRWKEELLSQEDDNELQELERNSKDLHQRVHAATPPTLATSDSFNGNKETGMDCDSYNDKHCWNGRGMEQEHVRSFFMAEEDGDATSAKHDGQGRVSKKRKERGALQEYIKVVEAYGTLRNNGTARFVCMCKGDLMV